MVHQVGLAPTKAKGRGVYSARRLLLRELVESAGLLLVLGFAFQGHPQCSQQKIGGAAGLCSRHLVHAMHALY